MKPQWIIDMTPLMNKKVEIETKEGYIRTGKLTRVVFQPLSLDGIPVEVPVSIEMDNSYTEAVPFDQLKRINRID